MKMPKWYTRTYYVCNIYLLEHHISYIIEPGRTVFRREHSTDGKPAKLFLVTSVLTLREAKFAMMQDFEAWLQGESLAEPWKKGQLTF